MTNGVSLTDPDFIRLQSKIDRWFDRIENIQDVKEKCSAYQYYLPYRKNPEKLLALVNKKRAWFWSNMFKYTYDLSKLKQNDDYFCCSTNHNHALLLMIGNHLQMTNVYNYIDNNKSGFHDIISYDLMKKIKVLNSASKYIRLYAKETIGSELKGETREIYWPIYEVMSNTMCFPKPLPMFGAWAFKVDAIEYAQIRVSSAVLETEPRNAIQQTYVNKYNEFIRSEDILTKRRY